mmetsp:Transcript_10154/g.13418  ORF Transcript_10154/g.13418 Transcript_10154/m.13418 type:complete len:531 (-) Transcript_10154:143-1735(-)
MARRQRRNYAQVSSVESEEQQRVRQEEDATNTSTNTTTINEENSSMSLAAAAETGSSASVSTEVSSLLLGKEDDMENHDNGINNDADIDDNDIDIDDDDLEKGEGGVNNINLFNVVILDVAQKKFTVSVNNEKATVLTLKQVGFNVHKVSPDRQRLIFRGKMLQDDKTLHESGITTQNTIIHLFPKPRVIIKSSTNNSNNASSQEVNSQANNSDDEDEEGARVPTIVLDADEAERRSQILVLGSSDYLEAQNNVKLFSFMLLIYSSIELVSLLGLALGFPQEEPGGANGGGTGGAGLVDEGYPVSIDDDILGNSSGDNNSKSNDFMDHYDNSTLLWTSADAGSSAAQWKRKQWVDLIISIAGVYVGVLGLQATSLNTLRLARMYMVGTFGTGLAWMIFNLVVTFYKQKLFEKNREENHSHENVLLDDDDLRMQAISFMFLPGMVWILCCLRSWQFQYLIAEAEQEAEERIRAEFANITSTTTTETTTTQEHDDGNLENNEQHTATTLSTPTTAVEHDEELALQNESARIS